MEKDTIDLFVEYFYQHNYYFDKNKEQSFREKMLFARVHYSKTDEFLSSFYYRWCVNADTFVIPYGVFRVLFFEEWKPLGQLWVQNLKTKSVLKK
jgi:hypothetical protein